MRSWFITKKSICSKSAFISKIGLKHSFKNFTTKSTIKYILGDKLSTQTISENVAIIYYVQTEQINNFNISLLNCFINQSYKYKKC